MVYLLSYDTRHENSDTPHSVQVFRRDQSRHPIQKIALRGCIIPNLRFPVNSNNNSLVFAENDTPGTTFTATLTPGNYTITQILVEIKTQMDSVGANTYTCTYTDTTDTINITSAPNNFAWNSTTTAGRLLGLDLSSTTSTFTTSYNNDYPARLDGTSYLDIAVGFPVHTTHNDSSKNHSLLARIYMPVSYGETLIYEAPHINFHPVHDSHTREFTISLYDDEGNLFVLPKTAYTIYDLLVE